MSPKKDKKSTKPKIKALPKSKILKKAINYKLNIVKHSDKLTFNLKNPLEDRILTYTVVLIDLFGYQQMLVESNTQDEKTIENLCITSNFLQNLLHGFRQELSEKLNIPLLEGVKIKELESITNSTLKEVAELHNMLTTKQLDIVLKETANYLANKFNQPIRILIPGKDELNNSSNDSVYIH